jgi:hypothetical protein
MSIRYATGDNFTLDLEEDVAVCRLFKRSDLDGQALARSSLQLLSHGRALTVKNGIVGLVVDLRRVPGAMSPEVARAYQDLASAWEKTGQRVAFLIVDDPIQMMQLGRIVNENAPRFGALMTDRNEARRFAGAASPLGPTTGSLIMDRPTRTRRP